MASSGPINIGALGGGMGMGMGGPHTTGTAVPLPQGVGAGQYKKSANTTNSRGNSLKKEEHSNS